MYAHAGAQADRGHGRTLGEELGIGADPDLEILRPHVPGDEDVLDAGGFRRAGTDAAEIRPDDGLDVAPGAVGEGGIAPRPLFDDALEKARDEGDAARLHGLEIARGEEPRA